MRFGVLGLVWVGFLATFAAEKNAWASGLTVISQLRRVEAAALATDDDTMDGQTNSAFAPDDGLFDAPVNAAATKGAAAGSASGIQRSSLSSFAIRGTGSHSSSAEVVSAPGSSFARGGSRLFVRFQLDQPSGYVLRGFVEAFDLGLTTAALRDGLQEIHALATSSDDHIDFEESGTLAAGIYELDIDTSGSSSAFPFVPESSSGAFDVALILESALDAPQISSVSPVAFPNPFRSQTRIQIPSGARDVNVFDLRGRLVRSWNDATSVQWDGRDEAGLDLPAGVYFLRVDGLPGSNPTKIVRVR